MSDPVQRALRPPERTFFLFGPRGTGKSTWLRQQLPDALHLDLLDASLYLELSRDPHRLEALVGRRPEGAFVILDEIQKVPALLDEVHRLMETRRLRFALCGSSARKLRRTGVNLLGGRALTLTMEPFTSAELGEAFDLDFSLEWGQLPGVERDREYATERLVAYVNTYLKEEIREEGLVRQVPPFLRFLEVAGLMNGQVVSGQALARDAGIPRSTVDTYFSILMDTLLGHLLPAWQPRLRVRERAHPKFYWFDPGVARAAAGLARDPADRAWLGFALETLIFHELRVWNQVSGKHRDLRHYASPAGPEIDFVIETRKARQGVPPHVVCIEVKLAPRWDRAFEKPMRSLAALSGVAVDRMIGVYTGPRAYHFDGVDVLPVQQFLRALHAGEVF